MISARGKKNRLSTKFVRTGARYRVQGTESYGGTRAFKLEGVPKEAWYYGRTVTWLAAADAGSGAEEAVERDGDAVVEALEAGSTRRRVQESSGGGA